MVMVEVIKHVIARARRQRHGHQRMPLGTGRNTAAAAIAASTAGATTAALLAAFLLIFAGTTCIATIGGWRFVDKFARIRTFCVLRNSSKQKGQES